MNTNFNNNLNDQHRTFQPPPPNPYANPYGNGYGNPYAANPYANYPGLGYGMSYEQRMNYSLEMRRQQLEYQDKLLRENYPVKYAICHSVTLFLLSFALIALQIVLIIYKIGLYYVGSGIWAGAYLILCASLVLLLIKQRNRCLFTIVVLLHFFGLLVCFGGVTMVNIISLVYSSVFSSSSSSSSIWSYYTTTTTTTTASNVSSTTSTGIPIALIVLGAVCAIVCCVFFCAVNCMLNPSCGGKNRSQINPNGLNQQNIQMSNYPSNMQNTSNLATIKT